MTRRRGLFAVRLPVVLGLTLISVASCGGEIERAVPGVSASAAMGIGACNSQGNAEQDQSSAWGVLSRASLLWFSTRNLAGRGQVADGYEVVAPEEATSIRPGTLLPSVIRLRTSTLMQVDEVRNQASRYFVGVDSAGRAGLVVGVVGQEAIFLGVCAAPYTMALKAYSTSVARSSAAVLEEIVSNPNGATTTSYNRFFEPGAGAPQFSDLPPNRRQVDLTDKSVPASLIADLEQVTIRYRLPASWQEPDALDVDICGRIPDAWVQCTSLKGRAPDRPFDFTMFTRPGVPLELWLGGLGERNIFGKPYGKLVTIPALKSGNMIVLVEPVRADEDLPALIARLEAGEPGLMIVE